ncbi:MAG: response regulator transcription factor [Chloroflexi bacterium]|nr:response regulator transcription factor [Chloroflexota bacterium]
MTNRKTILLVGGRRSAAEHFVPMLEERGLGVVTAHTRRDALTCVNQMGPDAVVLDKPSVRFDPARFCSALRQGSDVPVLMLITQDDQIDRAVGARGHLRYPFTERKLVSRIDRLIPDPDDEVLRMGDIVFSVKQQSVIYSARETHLTPKQARLLEIFMRHPGEVLTRAYLMKQVWDTEYLGDTRTLDVHIHWLRKAIEDDPKSPTHLLTLRRRGYRFEPSDEA